MLPYSSSETPAGSPASQPAFQATPPQTPLYKRPAFIVGLTLGLIVLAGAAFSIYYLFFRTPPPSVDLKVVPPDHVLLGEPFTLTVSYQNNSAQTLQAATLAITLPDGVSVLGVPPSTRVSQQDLGDVGPQEVGSRTFDLIATDGSESIKHIAAALRYQLNDNAASRFETDAGGDVAVGEPAVKINFAVPQNVFAGQDFTTGVTYQNNSQTAFTNTRLFFDYPQNFQYVSASGTPSNGNNEWDLDTLTPAAQGGIAVTGHAQSGAQSFFTLGVHLQVDIQGQTYTLAAQTANVAIAAPLLSLAITANDKPDYVASLGEQVTYTLTYHNSSNATLKNVNIQAALAGALFDPALVTSAGTLDSVHNTLAWNPANTPALASVDPGVSGSVQFQVHLASVWPIHKASDKNFTFQVHGTIQSLTVPSGITADQTRAAADITTKVNGQMTLDTPVYYKDAAAVPANTGPYPPRVNQPTQYTVHWRIRDYATDATNIHIEGTLQSGAHLVAVLKSTAASQPVYDSQTGKVTWDIATVPANIGVVNPPLEAVFRIEATPGANAAGQDLPLVSETTLTATDGFTGSRYQIKTLAKNSSLPDDTQVAASDRRVQP